MATVMRLERFDKLGATAVANANGLDNGLETTIGSDGTETLDPVSVQPSPHQEKLEAALQELDAGKVQIAKAVQTISAELIRARQKIISESAEAMAKSFAELLPSLLDRGFVHELSTATIQIAKVIEPEKITLQSHPKTHDVIVDALKSFSPTHPITVTSDPNLSQGQIRLSWPEGGAEIDQTALLRHAAELFESRLASFVSGKDQDDH